MSIITNYSIQCSIIPLCPVLQSTAASAISSPYFLYYNLQHSVQYQPLMSSITNYSSHCSIVPLCQVLQTTVVSAVSSTYIKYYKLRRPVQYHPLMSSISKHRCSKFHFFSASIAQASETLLSLPQHNLTATLLDCMKTLSIVWCCWTLTHLLAVRPVHCTIM